MKIAYEIAYKIAYKIGSGVEQVQHTCICIHVCMNSFYQVPGTIRYLARSGTWHDQVPGTIWYLARPGRSGTWYPYILQMHPKRGEVAHTRSVGNGQAMYGPLILFTLTQPSPLGCCVRWVKNFLASLARSSGLGAAMGWLPTFLLLHLACTATPEACLVCLIRLTSPLEQAFKKA